MKKTRHSEIHLNHYIKLHEQTWNGKNHTKNNHNRAFWQDKILTIQHVVNKSPQW